MKKEIRVLGIDDGPFSFDQEKVVVIGVVMRGSGYIEGILKGEVEVDGDDSTKVLVDMINGSRYHDQVKATMLDGIALGGFNIVDIRELYRRTKIPVITITRDLPDLDKMKETLQRKFENWEEKWRVIEENHLLKFETSHSPIYVALAGIQENDAREIIRISTIRGVIPEPLRVAHLIASGIVKGESHGKA